MKKASNRTQPDSCPCGNNASYEACCARWHHGPERLMAPDAATLMRSRYTAFVLNELDYLLDTWHPSTRPTHIEPNPLGLKWLGLQVRNHTQQDDNHATVEFVARSRLSGRANRLHEISRFVRENGRWFYLEGDISY
jgi:SEC-C motif-containing protein